MSATDELEAEGEALEGQLELLDPYTRAAVEYFDVTTEARLVRLAMREILVRGLPRLVCHITAASTSLVKLATIYDATTYPKRWGQMATAAIETDGKRWYVLNGGRGQRINETGYGNFPAAFTAALSVLGYSAQGIPK